MPETHTSVIFFHGVGDPKRNVSLSNFLDYFDLFGQTQSKNEIGWPRVFKYKSELFKDDVVNYVEFKRILDVAGNPKVDRVIRVYEAYWAPESTARFKTFYIGWWLFLRVINPLRVAISKWRNFPTVRLLLCHKLAGTKIEWQDAMALEQTYRDFENWENRREYPAGRFTQFISLIKKKNDDNHIKKERMIKSARLWKNHFIIYNLKISLHIFLLILFLLWLLYLNYLSARNLLNLNSIEEELGAVVVSSSIILISTTFVLTWWLKLKNYAYDIITWTMESEKDVRYATRRRVVQYAQDLIRHIAGNELCQECVIISHSLGTCIATEALLKEGQKSLLSDNNTDDTDQFSKGVKKIKFIFTIDSPIDRIFYLFQTDSIFSHRYNRLREEQRLSVSLPPFWLGDKSGDATIVNFWSRFDPISSQIYSLRKSLSERRNAISNIEACPSRFPFPIGTHTSYFSDRNLMKKIYWVTMTGRLPNEPMQPDQFHLDWAGRRGLWLIVSFAFIILGLLTLTFERISYGPLAVAICACFLVGGYIWRKRAVVTYQKAYGPFLRR